MSPAAMQHQSNKLVWIRKLIEDPSFQAAVHSQSLKDAAQAAVDLLVQPHRGGSHGLPGLYMVPQLKPHDRVRLKVSAAEDERAKLRTGGLRSSLMSLEGTVVHILQASSSGNPTSVRVKWSNGQERDHPTHDLELIRSDHLDMGRSNPKLNILVNGQDVKLLKKSPGVPKSRDVVKRVKRELAELETELPWHMVDDSWKQRRNGWRNRLKSAETAAPLSQCLKELLAVLRIQKDMPNVVLKMTQEEFVSTLDSVAANKAAQAPLELGRLWDHIKAELYTWMHVKDEKHKKKAQHVHLAHALQAFEACYAHGEHAYHQVPIHRILTSQHERELARLALIQEQKFAEAKLSLLESNPSPAAWSQLLNGVTYETNGLGGSYGGMPRTGRSMLEGVLHFDSDAETELDVGSEATDLADSEPNAPDDQEHAASQAADMEVDG